jgi:hypothetical protein
LAMATPPIALITLLSPVMGRAANHQNPGVRAVRPAGTVPKET